MKYILLGLILITIILGDFCFAQSNCVKDLEFRLNFSNDSVIRFSEHENSELFNAVKKIVFVDVYQTEYPIFKMRIWCKVDKKGQIISTNVKALNFDTKNFIDKDVKSLFCKIRKFNFSGISFKEKVTNIVFILDAWQSTNKFIFIGGFARPGN